MIAMKKALIAMLLMALLMTLGGGLIGMMFSSVLGGGVEQSYIYPIYGGIVALTGVVVGSAEYVIHEIQELKRTLEDNK